ncbi:MAG: hypothetical protein IPK64_18460 [bacterium]|nr:hypothetical protein [bacterium]
MADGALAALLADEQAACASFLHHARWCAQAADPDRDATLAGLRAWWLARGLGLPPAA